MLAWSSVRAEGCSISYISCSFRLWLGHGWWMKINLRILHHAGQLFAILELETTGRHCVIILWGWVLIHHPMCQRYSLVSKFIWCTQFSSNFRNYPTVWQSRHYFLHTWSPCSYMNEAHWYTCTFYSWLCQQEINWCGLHLKPIQHHWSPYQTTCQSSTKLLVRPLMTQLQSRGGVGGWPRHIEEGQSGNDDQIDTSVTWLWRQAPNESCPVPGMFCM